LAQFFIKKSLPVGWGLHVLFRLPFRARLLAPTFLCIPGTPSLEELPAKATNDLLVSKSVNSTPRAEALLLLCHFPVFSAVTLGHRASGPPSPTGAYPLSSHLEACSFVLEISKVQHVINKVPKP
jgi:hypothetical protein